MTCVIGCVSVYVEGGVSVLRFYITELFLSVYDCILSCDVPDLIPGLFFCFVFEYSMGTCQIHLMGAVIHLKLKIKIFEYFF